MAEPRFPVLFVTSSRIGDAVLSSGLLARLVEEAPHARFTVAAGPLAAPLFRDLPGLDRLIVFDKRRHGLHWLDLWRQVRGRRWGLVLDMRGSGLARLLDARRRAVRHMEKNRVVIFAAGTGNPFFTTDTAAALRAAEMNCDMLLKGTQVDGVYSADPRRDPKAERYEQLTYHDVLAKDLAVMDASAISLARENGLPIVVFNIHAAGAFAQVMRGEGRFTTIRETPDA